MIYYRIAGRSYAKLEPLDYAAMLLLITACVFPLLTGCAHDPVIAPDGLGGAILSIDATGVNFTDQGKELWVSEGVPREWFVNNHLTDLQWHQGQSIRLKKFNP